MSTAMDFAEALNQKVTDNPERWHGMEFEVINGRRYDKVVSTSRGSYRSIYAFVERKTGLLYKPATRSAPAKHARYSLAENDGFEAAIDAADPYGGFLYMR